MASVSLFFTKSALGGTPNYTIYSIILIDSLTIQNRVINVKISFLNVYYHMLANNKAQLLQIYNDRTKMYVLYIAISTISV